MQLQFTKDCTSPGGARSALAPEVIYPIERASKGQQLALDYTKNDVFAAGVRWHGLIVILFSVHSAGAMPWR